MQERRILTQNYQVDFRKLVLKIYVPIVQYLNLEKIVEGERLYLRLLRDVKSGEELFFIYNDYARDRFINLVKEAK